MTSQVTGRPSRLRPSDEVQGAGCRQVREVEPRARHVPNDVREQREVARDRGLLGRRRPAAQPEDRRDVALVRLGARRQRRLLGVLDDRQPERSRIRERVPHQRRRGDRCTVVAEPDDPCIGQLAEGGEASRRHARRDRAPGERSDRRSGRGRGRADPREDRRVVERRRRVRHRADRREPAVRRPPPARTRSSRRPRCPARAGGRGGRRTRAPRPPRGRRSRPPRPRRAR